MAVLSLTSYSLAQDTPSNPPPAQAQVPDSPSTAKQKAAQKTEEQRRIEREEQSNKILGVVPNYNVTTEKTAIPLTPSEKFKLFARSSFSPFEFVAVGAEAGISQGLDKSKEYGQGAEGYGKRYGAAFADQVSSNFFSNYAYPVIFREDPRYFRLGEGTFGHRLGGALKQVLVAHRDRGGTEFAFSNVLGAFTAGAVSNLYYPESDRNAKDTLSRSAISLAYGGLGNLASEFWPDVRDKWFNKHKKKKDSQNQP